ncbi:serine hydrolase domain-containing protein [Phycicoccus avicenniae]|uniref:serine hydrolase domain-containing protein n=1 Tax=Phycicoccus avicenniae TaxID=2828860 RepID=UPI003D2C21C1
MQRPVAGQGVDRTDGFAGCVLVARGDEVLYRAEGGPADREAGTTCSPQTRFQIASVSKQFAAALVLLLVQEGVVDLARPIGTMLGGCPAAWRDLTLHHLISNTSGIEHWQALPGFDPVRPGEREGLLERMAALPLRHVPGSAWTYSSPGFLLAATVVEAVTGRRWPDLVASRLLEPLGLASTTVGAVPHGDVARGYRGGRRVDVDDYAWLPGTGDLWSTVDDLARWTTALHGGGVLTGTSHARLVHPHGAVGTDSPPGGPVLQQGYGYGCFLGSLAGRRAWMHPGDNPGYRSFVAHLPDTGETVVALTNEESVDLDDVLRRVVPVLDGASALD